MAIRINDECIVCDACAPECPNNAIYEPGVDWALADGTSTKGAFALIDGSVIDASRRNVPISSCWPRKRNCTCRWSLDNEPEARSGPCGKKRAELFGFGV